MRIFHGMSTRRTFRSGSLGVTQFSTPASRNTHSAGEQKDRLQEHFILGKYVAVPESFAVVCAHGMGNRILVKSRLYIFSIASLLSC